MTTNTFTIFGTQISVQSVGTFSIFRLRIPSKKKIAERDKCDNVALPKRRCFSHSLLYTTSTLSAASYGEWATILGKHVGGRLHYLNPST